MNNYPGSFRGDGPVVPLTPDGTLRQDFQAIIAAPQKPTSLVSPGEILRTLLKWWWLIGSVVLACVAIAVVASLVVDPMYRAQTVLEANQEGVQVVKMGELDPIGMEDRQFISTQAGLLRSRGLAERVVRNLNLAANEGFASQDLARAERERVATDRLLKWVEVEVIRDSRLIQVNVISPDAALSAKIANAYADNFIRSNLERRYEANSYARNFLQQRIDSLRTRLEKSERDLVGYARREGIINLNVDSGSGQNTRSEQPLDANSLVTQNDALQKAQADRIAAEGRYREARSGGSVTESISNPTIQALTQQRAELQAQYQQNLQIFRPNYPRMVQMRSRIASLDSAISRERADVSGSLLAEYRAASARESALRSRVDALRNNLLDLRSRSIQYTILQREVDTNRQLYDALLQRFREVGVAGGVGTNAVSVVDQARAPQAPFKPNVPLNVALGLLAGLLLGVGVAFWLEWIDDSVKNPDDVRSKVGIVPLGVVPIAPKNSDLQQELTGPRSQTSEAYQSIRTALQFATDHGVPRSILVTSTRAAEGKSSTSYALARSIAALGKNVLIIDCDLRKPTFQGPDGKSGAGLSNVLSGSMALSEVISATDLPGLSLVPSGPIPPNPAELLSSDRLRNVIHESIGRFDHVIVDSPPVLGLADAPLLSSICEGTLIVVESAKIRRTAVVNAVDRLRSAGANIMGCVLTKFSATKSGYGYGYGYGYGEDKYGYGDTVKVDKKRQIKLSGAA